MRKLLALAALLAVIPLSSAEAQTKKTRVELSLLAGYAGFLGDTAVSPNVEIDTGSGPGGGLLLGVRCGMIKVEAGAMVLRGKGSLEVFGEESLSLGHIDLIPIMAVATFHPLSGRFDPYFGVGGAYVIGQDLRSNDLDTVGIGVVDLDSKAAVVGNLGFGFGISDGAQVVVDARYLHLEMNSIPKSGGVEQKIKMNPVIVSGGFVIRF